MARGKLTWTGSGSEFPEQSMEGVRGLRREQLTVVFQPIVDVSTGRTFAHEALVRCDDSRYPTPPALFDAAVKEEACGRLGRRIREIAFATCGDNALFVNLHPQELASRWLVKPDDPIGFHDRPVYLEITESAAFTHFDLCMSVLKELCRRTGAHLVIDDFGAGYSNLERVADLQPAVVKLDLALARDIHRQRARQIVVRHVVQMCKELGSRVIAEGVETSAELRCLCELGVEYVQGYLLARPAAPPPQPVWPSDVARVPRAAAASAPVITPVAVVKPVAAPKPAAPAPTTKRSTAAPRSNRSTSRTTKPVPRG